MAPIATSRKEMKGRCLRSAAKYAAIGALVLGAVAFIHTAWDAYKFSLSGRESQHPIVLVTSIITALGLVAGGAVGAVVGVVVAFIKGRNDAGTI
jgi:hypothetical protein